VGAFEYLSVLISIILGLALTQLLTGTGKLIRHRRRVRPFAPTLIWMFFLLLMIVQTWWTMFALRQNQTWTFLEFVLVLAQPTLLYLLVELILPETDVAGVIDLEENYFTEAPVFFSLGVLVICVSLVRPFVLSGEWAEPADVATQLVWLALSLAAIFWRNRAYHRVLAPTMAVIAIAYVADLFRSLR
jgi:hypothetical protein